MTRNGPKHDPDPTPSEVPTRWGEGTTGSDLATSTPSSLPGLGPFAGYDLLRVIFSGGMGTVYEAHDPQLDRRIALKVLNPALLANPVAVESFLKEAKALAAITNDYVVTIYAVSRFENQPFLTMELLTGHSIRQFTTGHPRDWRDVLKIARDVLLGLKAVHAAQLIHRDIKPENLWYDARTNRVRLLDFGLVYRPGDSTQLVGTPGYMSPEQLRGESLDPRSDLYSLGAVLYELLTGQRAFSKYSLKQLASSDQPIAPPSMRDLAPHLPTPLHDLVHQLLQPNPADRPASAEVVLEQLSEIDRRSPRVWLRRVLIVTPILLALAAVAYFLLMNEPNTTAPASTTPKGVPARPTTPSWIPLFRQGDHDNWRLAAKSTIENWRWNGDILAADGRPEGSTLLTVQEYQDFELDLEYRWPAMGGHTTVCIRSGPHSDVGDAIHVNIGDDENFEKIHGRPIGKWYASGTVFHYPQTVPPPNHPIGEWNHLRIHAQGKRIRVVLNEKQQADVTLDTMPPDVATFPKALGRVRGHIGIRSHQGAIEYRNIRVRPLSE